MREIQVSLADFLTLHPAWQPPATLGQQFFAWGEGGPSGNPAFKAGTAIPWPVMQTMNIPMDVQGPSQFLFGMIPPPQGVSTSRPVNPMNNALADTQNYALIMGLSKT